MDNIDLKKFIRADISRMAPYEPAPYLADLAEKYSCSKDDIVKLDQGENPYGSLPSVKKIFGQREDTFSFYPDPEYKRLRLAIAKYVGVDRESIMVGSGADELADLTLRLIIDAGDEIVSCPPTYGMSAMLIGLNKGKIVPVPRNDDFSLNIKGILDAINKKTKAISVCSPNNPTGNTATEGEIKTILGAGKLVIVDEAYFEFCGKTNVPLLKEYKNLIVLRTFSKWAGLAGLRLGYAIMDPYLVRETMKIKLPFNVNSAAEIGGLAALNDLASAREIIGKIASERERVREALGKLPGLAVYPSEANFLFIKVSHGLSDLKNHLEQNRIFPRYYKEENAVRLSIGRPEQNDKVIACFGSFNGF